MPDNDLLSSLKGMLGDNADEKINAVVNMLKSNNRQNEAEPAVKPDNDMIVTDSKKAAPVSGGQSLPLTAEGIEYMGKIKHIIDELGTANDRRSNLLMSLRPYMRDERKKSIDNAVKILNLSRLSGLFKI